MARVGESGGGKMETTVLEQQLKNVEKRKKRKAKIYNQDYSTRQGYHLELKVR